MRVPLEERIERHDIDMQAQRVYIGGVSREGSQRAISLVGANSFQNPS